jgi:hypothetical protein
VIDIDDFDAFRLFVDRVQNAIVANPKASAFSGCQFEAIRRARLFPEFPHFLNQAASYMWIEFP